MSTSLTDVVKKQYGAIAERGLSSRQEGISAVAEAFGYSPEELQSIPAESNMGLSCGNPLATAHLRSGETVVDLGSGGGLDVFLAAEKVGPEGRAIGIDMTPEMIALARENARYGPKGTPYTNVEFRQGSIESIPLPDGMADCVISNCVINLTQDKESVFREIFRILKPGGRVAISDIALRKPLPKELAQNLMAYVGCIAGAIPIEAYRAGLLKAGFADVEVIDSGADLHAYAKAGAAGCCAAGEAKSTNACCANGTDDKAECCEAKEPTHDTCCSNTEQGSSCCAAGESTELHDQLSQLLAAYDLNELAASVRVLAVKR